MLTWTQGKQITPETGKNSCTSGNRSHDKCVNSGEIKLQIKNSECDMYSSRADTHVTASIPIATTTTTENNANGKFIVHKQKYAIGILLILLLGVLEFICVQGSQTVTDMNVTEMGEANVTAVNPLCIVNRKEWQAFSPSDELYKLDLPVHRIIISHTTTNYCYTKENCIYRFQTIQAFHMNSFNWHDIGFNFLIGGDGYVYEGRGWDYQGAHTKGYNTDSYGISFIGTFTTLEPTQKQLRAAKLLIEEGVSQHKIASNYRLYGARQMQATESPGEALFSIIKKWPHFSDNVH